MNKEYKPKKRSEITKSCYCNTSDNWYPPCDNNTVNISLTITDKIKCISAWGDDDFGMSIDFDLKIPRHEILNIYNKIISMKDVTIKSLLELGFKQD